MRLFDLDWWRVLDHFVLMTVAFALALPIAWNREVEERGAGLRTFPLVALASCGYMLTGMSVLDTTDAESRVVYGIITGIGFIGGGAILKSKGRVSGTATAASIWNTGAIGVAVAFGRLEIAVVLSVINVVALRLGSWVKSRVQDQIDGE